MALGCLPSFPCWSGKKKDAERKTAPPSAAGNDGEPIATSVNLVSVDHSALETELAAERAKLFLARSEGALTSEVGNRTRLFLAAGQVKSEMRLSATQDQSNKLPKLSTSELTLRALRNRFANAKRRFRKTIRKMANNKVDVIVGDVDISTNVADGDDSPRATHIGDGSREAPN